MLFTRLRAIFPLTIVSLLTGALTMGCGGATVEDVCNTCPANSKDVASCISEGNSAQADAEKAGCGAEFQAEVDCAHEKATCDAGGHLKVDVCDAESNAVDKCGNK
jgi:hypothetical protein